MMVAPYMDPKKGKENDKQGVAGSIGTITRNNSEVIGVEQSQGLGVAGSIDTITNSEVIGVEWKPETKL